MINLFIDTKESFYQITKDQYFYPEQYPKYHEEGRIVNQILFAPLENRMILSYFNVFMVAQ
jgi:hypothetical protein